MLRLTQLKLPLGHPPEALRDAVLERLGGPAAEIVSFEVFRRAHDARRKAAILMVYTVDVTVSDEAEVLARHAGDPLHEALSLRVIGGRRRYELDQITTGHGLVGPVRDEGPMRQAFRHIDPEAVAGAHALATLPGQHPAQEKDEHPHPAP